jgi:hypothetical protein
MDEISKRYREAFLRSQRAFQTSYRKLFGKVAEDIAILVNDPISKYYAAYKSFRFSEPLQEKITEITKQFHDDALSLNVEQIEKSWSLANEKNDEIVNEYLRTITGITSAKKSLISQ